MSRSVFIVSEWLPRAGKETQLWEAFKKLMTETRQEAGCIRAHATRQIQHPSSPGKSQYTMVMLQEYRDLSAFDYHVKQSYVTDFFKHYIDPKDAIVADWRCRLFEE